MLNTDRASSTLDDRWCDRGFLGSSDKDDAEKGIPDESADDRRPWQIVSSLLLFRSCDPSASGSCVGMY